MPIFIFDSTGGCARCDGMDKENKEYPNRPHPYCDCLIYAKQSKHCYELGEVTTSNSVGYGKDHGSYITFKYHLEYDMNVTCLKTGVVETVGYSVDDEVDVEKEDYPGDDEMLKEMLAEWLYDAVEEHISLAKDVCNCK